MMVQPDTAASVGFLKWWRPKGVLTLASFNPARRNDGDARSWQIGEDASVWDEIAHWIDARQGRRNLYYTVNEAWLIQKKPKKEDIVSIVAAYTDADPDTSRGYEAARAALLETAEQWAGGELPPTAIIDSGHGLNALWRLSEDMTDVDAFEAINKPFSEHFGSKGIFNADRLLRLPGTMNLPDAVKLGKGYPAEPAVSRVLYQNGACYTADELRAYVNRKNAPADDDNVLDFNRSETPPNLDGLPDELAAKLRAQMASDPWLAARWSGDPTKLNDTTRSGFDMSLGSMLKRRGFTFEEMCAALRAYPHGKGAENTDRDLARIWERSQTAETGPATAFATAVEPVDLWGTIGAPELPTGLLPAVIERFATEQADMMGADAGGLAASALAVCAAAIPDRIKIQVKRHDPHWLESARLWVALIGTPSAKKSPIISTAVKPLTRLDAKLYRDYAEALARYNALPKEERATSTPPKQKRLRIEDTTIEAAQQALADSPDGVLCIQDELSGWFGSMDKYAGNRGAAKDRGFWLQAFNGGAYALNRVGRGASLIENLSVSMLGGIQPEPIRKLAAEAHDDGLLQRLFPIVLRPATVGKDEPSSDVVAQYGRLIERLTQLRPPERGGNLGLPEATPLKLDDGAQAIRRDLEQRHHDLMCWEAINPKLAAHVGKLDGLFARLCIVWHCIENGDATELPPVVTERTAKRVAAFMRRFLFPHAAAFFHSVLGLSDDHDRLAAVAGYILARKLERLTSRDIQRGDRTMRGLTRHDRERVFEQLEALGWLEQTPGPRPSDPPHWIVNPAVHQRFADRAKQEAQRRKAAHAMILELTRAA